MINRWQLNYKIENFSYRERDRSSKPPPLSDSILRTKGHLAGTASQKCSFFRLLKSMIGHCMWCKGLPVAQRNRTYSYGTYYREILDFQTMFSGKQILKMDFLIHYLRLLMVYGPLRGGLSDLAKLAQAKWQFWRFPFHSLWQPMAFIAGVSPPAPSRNIHNTANARAFISGP